MMDRYDLHTHTTCSDGSYSPRELIDLAVTKGLAGIAITDHDTIAAFAPEVLAYAKAHKIDLLQGVEISAYYKGQAVHILAYDFKLDVPELHEFITLQEERRRVRAEEILEKLRAHGFEITFAELQRSHGSPLGRPHIAALLIRKGVVENLDEAFARFLGDSAPCFVPMRQPEIPEALRIIHAAGGKAFIAHPHFYNDFEFVKELAAFHFDGIECYYARFSYQVNMRYKRLAERRNLLVSGGSDFHGQGKPFNDLGVAYLEKANLFPRKNSL